MKSILPPFAEDETITGGLIIGYPEKGLPDRNPLERKGNPITWVESEVSL